MNWGQILAAAVFVGSVLVTSSVSAWLSDGIGRRRAQATLLRDLELIRAADEVPELGEARDLLVERVDRALRGYAGLKKRPPGDSDPSAGTPGAPISPERAFLGPRWLGIVAALLATGAPVTALALETRVFDDVNPLALGIAIVSASAVVLQIASVAPYLAERHARRRARRR